MRYLYLIIATVITYWLAWLADNRPADYYDRKEDNQPDTSQKVRTRKGTTTREQIRRNTIVSRQLEGYTGTYADDNGVVVECLIRQRDINGVYDYIENKLTK